jgi:hypothetical protein
MQGTKRHCRRQRGHILEQNSESAAGNTGSSRSDDRSVALSGRVDRSHAAVMSAGCGDAKYTLSPQRSANAAASDVHLADELPVPPPDLRRSPRGESSRIAVRQGASRTQGAPTRTRQTDHRHRRAGRGGSLKGAPAIIHRGVAGAAERRRGDEAAPRVSINASDPSSGAPCNSRTHGHGTTFRHPG